MDQNQENKKIPHFLPAILIVIVAGLFVGLIVWKASPQSTKGTTNSANTNQTNTADDGMTGASEFLMLKKGETRPVVNFNITVTLQSLDLIPCPITNDAQQNEICQKNQRGHAELVVLDQGAKDDLQKIQRVQIPSIPGSQKVGKYLYQLMEYQDDTARLLIRQVVSDSDVTSNTSGAANLAN